MTAPGETRPWPLLLLTGLGAWLAAIPLMAVIGLLLGDMLQRGVGPYVAGILLVGGAVVVLRGRGVPVFFEQLAFPVLLAGLGALGMGLDRDLPMQAASAVLCAVALALAWWIERGWLRMLFGAGAAACAVATVMQQGSSSPSSLSGWLGLHVALALWLAAMAWRPRASQERTIAYLEPVGSGWLVLVLAGLALWSGTAFLVAGVAPQLRGDGTGWLAAAAGWRMAQSVSGVLCVAAAAWLAVRWPGVRHPLAALAVAVLAVLAWFMPALGAVLLALAWTAAHRHRQLAGAAALAAAWIVGSFYYQLEWLLATKALVLAAAGALLGAAAWWATRRSVAEGGRAAALASRRPAGWIALCALGTLALANYAIWEKEDLIARGEKVFVELAPVDPRSLMQGDYMRLDYRLPPGAEDRTGSLLARRPFVIVQRDERGVARPVRIAHDAANLGPGERRIALTPKDGRWTIVSDAWFFREGEAARWEAARYGEFRVLPDGRALLVGLADAQLRTIARD